MQNVKIRCSLNSLKQNFCPYISFTVVKYSTNVNIQNILLSKNKQEKGFLPLFVNLPTSSSFSFLNSSFLSFSYFSFCSSAVVPEATFVHKSANIYGNVKLSKNCSIWPNVVIRGDVNIVRIDEGTNIQDGTVIHCSRNRPDGPGYSTIIGKNVTIGHMAMLHGCTIKDNVLIGMCSVVMDGAIIESDVILGAGSLVSPGKRLESGLWVGNPAKKKRDLCEQEVKEIRENAKHYVMLKNLYLNPSLCTNGINVLPPYKF